MRSLLTLAAALALGIPGASQAQDTARQVGQTRDGVVSMVFASKPGVCGDGNQHIGTGHNQHGRRNHDCTEGPVQVELRVRNGIVTAVDVNVGGGPVPAINTSTRAAVEYLLALAAQTNDAGVARRAVFPVVLADSVDPSAGLLRLARNKEVAREARKAAIFWLGQAAGDKATVGLKSLLSDADREVKKHAVFALSQIRSEASVSALMDVVKTSNDKNVRKSALFWLSQSDDPRVLALFEEILLKD